MSRLIFLTLLLPLLASSISLRAPAHALSRRLEPTVEVELLVTAGSDQVVVLHPDHQLPILSWSGLAIELADDRALFGIHPIVGHDDDTLTIFVDGYIPPTDDRLGAHVRLMTLFEYAVGSVVGRAVFEPVDGLLLTGSSLTNFTLVGYEVISMIHAGEVDCRGVEVTDYPTARTIAQLVEQPDGFTGFHRGFRTITSTDPVESLIRSASLDELRSGVQYCRVLLNINSGDQHSGWSNSCAPRLGEKMAVVSVDRSEHTDPARWESIGEELTHLLMVASPLLITTTPWDSHGTPVGEATWLGWTLPIDGLHISSVELIYTIVPITDDSVEELEAIDLTLDQVTKMVETELDLFDSHPAPSEEVILLQQAYNDAHP